MTTVDATEKDVEEIKKIYGLHQTSEASYGAFEKIYYIDDEYNSWVEVKYMDGSKHTLVVL